MVAASLSTRLLKPARSMIRSARAVSDAGFGASLGRRLISMAIPDFQSIMRPLLEAHSDGVEHRNRDLVALLADHFELDDEDRREMLPSGTSRLFDNRIGWAKTHIRQAGLLASPRRGLSVITDRGREVLRDFPDRIDLKILKQFDEYRNFRSPSSATDGIADNTTLLSCSMHLILLSFFQAARNK
ncbi:hypothetical protein CKO42_20475 [Lamprobacter modestohalophilus]|uniref:Restriction system protein Mrr-like N-terminal domain-containing protein n=2 Tax=Lamprobacter modestohalophilus TaxID=1064514 RepID=A0A9X0WD24_9GAMM|nr:hypothetical protein [Lamprobacter modestohalophilus]